MRLSALEEVEQFVLSWGTPAPVIEPLELRQRVLKTARELAARYA
jgi:predicted DNA-binding transcriptional regulator YafY